MYDLAGVVQALYELLRTAPETAPINWYYGRRSANQIERYPAGLVSGLVEGHRDRARTLPASPAGHEGQLVVAVVLLVRDERGPEYYEPALLGAVDAVLHVVARNPNFHPAVIIAQPDTFGWDATSAPEMGMAEAEIRFVVRLMGS